MNDAACTLLEWDSQFFGYQIARAIVPCVTVDSCRSMLDWCDARAVDCLYLFVAADDAETCRVAETNDFRLVDVRLDLERQLTGQRSRPPTPAIREATAEDLPQLRAIAGTSHRATRFYFDGRFQPERCDELYRTWITRSCEGWADGVLVATRGDEVAGYITMHLDDRTCARIGLVGVADAWRGRGVGTALVAAALAWFDGQGRTRIGVATQVRNVAGIRLYESAGFRVARVGLWYHRWFDRRPPA